MNAVDNYTFDRKWPEIHEVVSNILNQKNVSHREWQDTFFNVHMVTMWHDESANKIRETLEGMIIKSISEAEKRVKQNQDESALLRSYIHEWSKFFAQCEYLPKPFGSLENHLAGKNMSNQSKKSNDNSGIVRKMMLDTWNNTIFQQINHKLQASAMKLVLDERNGVVIDSQLVIGVRESYVNLSTKAESKLSIYQENFEKAYLEHTEQFYRREASQYLTDHGVCEYMAWVKQKLEEESNRAHKYLETSQESESVKNLEKKCVEIMIMSFTEIILAEFPSMIKANDTSKLSLMYDLLKRVPNGINPMLDLLEDHIKHSGLNDMMENADSIVSAPEKYVNSLLDMFERFTKLIELAFYTDPEFLTARDKAFQFIVNDTSIFKLDIATSNKPGSLKKPESRCPELLASYCDMLLRKGPTNRRLTTEQVEQRLQCVILLLKYVTNKDVFLGHYKPHLTRRLLLENSADNELEENMVEKLRDVGVPADMVNKLSRMFQDIKVCKDLNAEFKDALRNNRENVAEIVNIKILNGGAWMQQGLRVPLTLPRELEDYIPEVEEFYRKKHQGRMITWNYLMSHGVVTFETKSGKFDLDVTTFQMAILFSWNSRPFDRLSLESLQMATGLAMGDLKRNLWSLSEHGKLDKQLLVYAPKAKSAEEFTENTEFWINHDFSLIKQGKIQNRGRLNLIGRMPLTLDKKTQEQDESAIVELRKYRVQEGIIKIMKSRRQMRHVELCSELLELLRNLFQPSQRLIKEVIEWLIEEEYIKRDANDVSSFLYIA